MDRNTEDINPLTDLGETDFSNELIESFEVPQSDNEHTNQLTSKDEQLT